MAVAVWVYADYHWVPDGVGVAGQPFNAAANFPGGGTVGNAQTLRLQVGQPVQAVKPDAPTQAELETATTAAATQLNALLTTAVVAQIDGWATGNS